MPDHGGHIHPPGHFCGSNCPKHKLGGAEGAHPTSGNENPDAPKDSAAQGRKLPPLGVRERRVRVKFAWYDLWVGAYIDRAKSVLYICPFPTLLVEVRYGR
jgi:hypothetical protein